MWEDPRHISANVGYEMAKGKKLGIGVKDKVVREHEHKKEEQKGI